ncbi:hypothetical protein ACFXKX_33335 [Streptomyces scopuliridis]|uniref:hypothetical protein n=1 Tax=Streptomyces scopuliridis TaxID=452529 RepID=UPI003687EF34
MRVRLRVYRERANQSTSKDADLELIDPYLPIDEFGPCPARLRRQYEGVIWRAGGAGRTATAAV